MLGIFSCVYWPSVCLLWGKVCFGLPVFLIWLFIFLILSCMSCLYILEINPLSGPSFWSIVSRSGGCLFISFMVSLAVQKLLSLTRSLLFIFAFISITLGGRSYKLLLQLLSKNIKKTVLLTQREKVVKRDWTAFGCCWKRDAGTKWGGLFSKPCLQGLDSSNQLHETETFNSNSVLLTSLTTRVTWDEDWIHTNYFKTLESLLPREVETLWPSRLTGLPVRGLCLTISISSSPSRMASD